MALYETAGTPNAPQKAARMPDIRIAHFKKLRRAQRGNKHSRHWASEEETVFQPTIAPLRVSLLPRRSHTHRVARGISSTNFLLRLEEKPMLFSRDAHTGWPAGFLEVLCQANEYQIKRRKQKEWTTCLL